MREYGRDLNADIWAGDMSWRRFLTLWRGLGPSSLWRAVIAADGEQEITDSDEGERALENIFG